MAAAPYHAPWCSQPEVADYRRDNIAAIVSAENIQSDSTRRIWALSKLPADSVVVVTDETTCERAARAYYRHQLGPIPPSGVAVIRAGNRYLVTGAIRAGEWLITTVFTLHFETIVNIGT